MDFVDRMMGRSFAHINPNTLLKFSNLDAGTQRHLQKVYLTLACALAVTALGAYTDITFHVGGLLTFIVGFISMVWLTSMTASPSNLVRSLCCEHFFARIGHASARGPGSFPHLLLTAPLVLPSPRVPLRNGTEHPLRPTGNVRLHPGPLAWPPYQHRAPSAPQV